MSAICRRLALAAGLLVPVLGLGGCVVAPAPGVYAPRPPAAVYVEPRPYYYAPRPYYYAPRPYYGWRRW